MMIYVVFNEKGGAGKTTTTLNLYGILMAAGYSVVIVDMDKGGKALNVIASQNIDGLQDRVFSARDTDVPYVEALISEATKKFNADVVLIDCPPKFGEEWNTANILGDKFIVPGKASLIDRALTIKTAEMIARKNSGNVYILPTEIDEREIVSRQAITDYKSVDGVECLPTVRRATEVMKAMEVGEPVNIYNSAHEVSADYEDVVATLMA